MHIIILYNACCTLLNSLAIVSVFFCLTILFEAVIEEKILQSLTLRVVSLHKK